MSLELSSSYCTKNSNAKTLRIGSHYIDMTDTIGTIMVFLYVFSFYIVGPFTSSILAGMLSLAALTMFDKSRKWLAECLSTRYFFGISIFIGILITLGVFYSTVHFTFDFSYIKVMSAQFIHLLFGCFVVSWLYWKYDMTVDRAIKWVIAAYLVQSIIELVASCIPSLASALIYFNRADLVHRDEGSIRGLALAAGTTWSLGLTYGIVFILYFNTYLMRKINLLTVIGLILLVVGTFFAGRTGLVGGCIGFVYFMLFSRKALYKKLSIFIYIIFIIAIICELAIILFPRYVDFAIQFLLPWALEPLYNLIEGKGLTSASTNRLDEMWDATPTVQQALFGTGHFTNEDGSYYKHIDIGFTRNLFYWGIGGYLILIAYALYIVWPMFKNKHYRYMMIFTFMYLMLCEYKAMTIGFNKMAVSIIFLLSFTHILENRCRRFL